MVIGFDLDLKLDFELDLELELLELKSELV